MQNQKVGPYTEAMSGQIFFFSATSWSSTKISQNVSYMQVSITYKLRMLYHRQNTSDLWLYFCWWKQGEEYFVKNQTFLLDS